VVVCKLFPIDAPAYGEPRQDAQHLHVIEGKFLLGTIAGH
jgi:hypothetical protein